MRWLIGSAEDLIKEWSDRLRQLFERRPKPGVHGFLGGYFVVSATGVLHERMTGRHGLRGPQPLQSAHWS